MGDHNTSATNAAIWRTGPYANPVATMREFVEMFGHKPIIITEGAVTLFNTSNSEDLTEWALPRIRQVYSYIPMMFPEVKAIFWFNVIPGSLPRRVRYDFGVSPAAADLYRQLTGAAPFLGRGMVESPITFAEVQTVENGVTMPADRVVLLTYAPFFSLDNVRVEYRLDGAWLSHSYTIPYRRSFNLSDRPDGTHTLTVRIMHEGRVLQDIDYRLVIAGGNVTISRP